MGKRKKPAPMSNREKRAILDLFTGLPEGRSERNHSAYSAEQIEGITRLREVMTPKEIEALMNISVYKVHKLVLAGRRARHEKELREAKLARAAAAQRVGGEEPVIITPAAIAAAVRDGAADPLDGVSDPLDDVPGPLDAGALDDLAAPDGGDTNDPCAEDGIDPFDPITSLYASLESCPI